MGHNRTLVHAFYYPGHALKSQRGNHTLGYEAGHLSPLREGGILSSVMVHEGH